MNNNINISSATIAIIKMLDKGLKEQGLRRFTVREWNEKMGMPNCLFGSSMVSMVDYQVVKKIGLVDGGMFEIENGLYKKYEVALYEINEEVLNKMLSIISVMSFVNKKLNETCNSWTWKAERCGFPIESTWMPPTQKEVIKNNKCRFNGYLSCTNCPHRRYY